MKKVIRRFIRNNNWSPVSPVFYMIAAVMAYIAIASVISMISYGFEFRTIVAAFLFTAAALGCCILAEIASYRYHRRLEMRRMRAERRRASKLTVEEEKTRYSWIKDVNASNNEVVLYRVAARSADF